MLGNQIDGMFTVFVFLLTFVLVCTSAFVVLVVLMQRPSANSGIGSALGGGAAESAFGGETTKVLTKWTIYGMAVFFLTTLILSTMYISHNSGNANDELPIIIESADK